MIDSNSDRDGDSDMMESMMSKFFRVSLLILIPGFLSIGLLPGIGDGPRAIPHLLPMPKNIELLDGRLGLDSSFSVCLTGHGDPRISAALSRMIQRLREKTGMSLSTPLATDAGSATLEIRCTGSGEQVQSMRTDESYMLEVNGHRARLVAPSPVGVLRGMETFLQLVDIDERSFYVPAVQIRDEPRFCWRGLLIDVSRHWEPVEVIKRNLDAMEAVKLNVFHWHLSDDQGFRMESKAFPKLHRVGSEGNFYTQSEVKDIIAYARDRGIRVIPEFDMPGHATAILAAYPELASAPGPYPIERFWGVFDPSLDPTSRRVYSFLNSFIGEIAAIFPDEYFHIGGDEVSGKQWNANSKIRAFKERHQLRDNAALQAYFNQRLQKILAKYGKKMIGWDEILHSDLPKSVMVQSWRGYSHLAGSARQGYSGVLSYGYYLDAMRPAAFHYSVDPLDKEVAALPDDAKSRILGGEACMWAEFVLPDNIESRIWPRTAAIAERLWSPPDINNVQDMYRRLEFIDKELDSIGLRHQSNQIGMLQRMVGGQSAGPLKILADLLTPTSLSVRRKIQRYSSSTPLNRMVDAVLPESEAARQLSDLVISALANPSGASEDFKSIRNLLSLWRANASSLLPVLKQSFLLEEIVPLSQMVVDLSDKGLDALTYIQTGQSPDNLWKAEAADLIERGGKPHAEMLIAILPPIKKLMEAASSNPQ